MYWCKVARTEAEFDAIAKLNYETFVEEIPQHEKTTTGRRVDPFHNENTYVIVLKESTIVGMIALREQRPFSLDLKIGKVEEFIYDLGKACEIRLLAVKKEYRNGRVFFLLARALADLCHEIGYDSAVISGTTRELKLYGQLGFQAFAKPVGAGDAVFIPMVTTRRTYEQSVAARLQTKKALFHPGPVQLTKELAAPFGELPLSHRSAAFQSVYKEVKEQLVQLTDAQPYMLNGSGTLANEAMLGQVKRLQGKGIVLVNGEFGRRMVRQAKRWQLDFEVMEKPWGDPFSCEEIKQKVADGSFCWMIMIHGETSMGMINEVDKISSLCRQYNIKLCLDCISSFGAVPLSLKDIWLATAVSGKAVGTMSGLAFVFANHPIGPDSLLPAYLDLGLYSENVPFTISYGLLKSVNKALKAYPGRYALLDNRMKKLQQHTQGWPVHTYDFPAAVTFRADKEFSHFPFDAHLSGYELHMKSDYLTRNRLFQISCIQPDFEQDFESLMQFAELYREYHKAGNPP